MSYSRTDEEVMRRVVTFLRSQGINVWVDNEKLIPGTPVWETEIEKAIFGANATVVILSPDSKASEWVRREISYTERYHKRIFPVLVRGDENSSISIRLTNHQYVDIRDNEEVGLEKLGTALLFYLEDLEIQKLKALEEVGKQAQAKAEQEKEEREAVRLRLEREKAEREKLDRERLQREKSEKEKGEKKRVASKADDPAPPQAKMVPDTFSSRDETIEKPVSSRWFSILWIALGWGIGVPFGVSLIERIAGADNMNPTIFQVSRAIIGAVIGAFGGFITAMILWMENIISKRRNILGITLGWSAGWVIGWLISYAIIFLSDNPIGGPVGGVIGGTVGGMTTAYFLKVEGVVLHRKNTLTIALGWAIGWGVAETLLWMTNGGIGIGMATSLIGVIGGWVLYGQIETHPQSDGLREMPVWVQVLGVAMGWVFGLTVGFSYPTSFATLLGMPPNDPSTWMVGLNFAWILIGLIGGLVTAIMLTREKVNFAWKTIIWITLGWAVALPIGWQIGNSFINEMASPWIGIVQGALGGLITAIILQMKGFLSQRTQFLWIILGWSLSWGVFWMIGGIGIEIIDIPGVSEIGESFIESFPVLHIGPFGQIYGGLVGVIGSLVTIWQIRDEKIFSAEESQ